MKVIQLDGTTSVSSRTIGGSQAVIAEALKQACLSSRGYDGSFNLALPGGRSLSQFAVVLCEAIEAAQLKHKLNVYQIDERLFGDKNAPVIQDCLSALHLRQEQFHLFRQTHARDFGVSEYAATVPLLNAVILGVGDDGHVAGIFPNHESGQISDYGCYCNSPKPPNGRMTAGFDVLLDSRLLVGLFLGRAKWDVLEHVLSSNDSIFAYPAMVLKQHSNSIIITDSPPRRFIREV